MVGLWFGAVSTVGMVVVVGQGGGWDPCSEFCLSHALQFWESEGSGRGGSGGNAPYAWAMLYILANLPLVAACGSALWVAVAWQWQVAASGAVVVACWSFAVVFVIE